MGGTGQTAERIGSRDVMKAIVQDRYGSPDVLELKELEKPVVNDGGVLVRVHAAAVNPLDWHFVRGLPYVARVAFGLPKPKVRVRGVDVAGHIEAVGKDVKQLHTGDEVFGWCSGAFADYASAAEGNFVPKPANLTFEQAAGVPVARCHGPAGASRCGQETARAKGTDQWSCRRRRYLRSADC